MNTIDVEALERAEEWDLDEGEIQGPPARAQAVVSVAFEAEEFARLSEAAAARGQSIPQFVRQIMVASTIGGSAGADGPALNDLTAGSGMEGRAASKPSRARRRAS